MTARGRRPELATWAIVLAALALWVAWSPPGANDLRAGDEGYYGTLARNLLADRGQLVSPSLTPLGPPGDKPPLYGALLALPVAWLGPVDAAVRWPSLLCAALTALLLAALLRRFELPLVTWLGTALLLALPWFADASRSATPDIPLTVCGLAALVVLARTPITTVRAAWAGVLLGLAFEFKLWLAGLFVLPALVLIASAERGRMRALGALVATALPIAALHLLAVAALRPGDLAHWWAIYWQRFVVERVAGAGGALVAVRPPAFYWLVMAHAFVVVLPLVALGVEWCLREHRRPLARALLVWAACVLPLSLFAVKSGVYLYALVPAWAALAALGVVALGRGARPGAIVALFALGSAPWLAARLGGPVPPLGAWALGWGSFGLAWGLAALRREGAMRVALALALIGVALGLWRESQRMPPLYHRPGFREIASAVGGTLVSAPPAQRVFLAPEAPTFAYYWFRTGDYWGTPIRPWTKERFAEIAADTSLRVFVVDPTRELYGGWPDSATVQWLVRTTHEVSAEIGPVNGRPLALRVFVREPHAR